MKGLLLISLMSFSPLLSAADWKVLSETSSCPENVTILAKEGENYVLAVHKGHKRKLYSKDKSNFNPQEMTSTEYSSDVTKEKYLLGDPTFSYSHPGQVEGNPPKIDVFYSGRKEHCRMNLK